MRCVTLVKYAVWINGQPHGLIQPTRGLRQGDPLSPYLFLICAKGLSALLHQATHRKAIKEVATSVRGPRVSHLFFANDSLVFGRATVNDAKEIQRILKVYELSSGQPQYRQRNKGQGENNVWCSSYVRNWQEWSDNSSGVRWKTRRNLHG